MLIVLHWKLTTPEAKQRGIEAMDSCFAISIAVFCLQKLIYHLLKTNLTKFAAIWVKKGQRAGFLLLIRSIIPASAREKEKKEKKERGETNRRRRQKSNGCTLSFYNGYSWIFSAGPKPWDKRGGSLPDPFRPFGPQFGLKIRGGAPPGSATAVLEMVLVEKKNCLKEFDIWKLSF